MGGTHWVTKACLPTFAFMHLIENDDGVVNTAEKVQPSFRTSNSPIALGAAMVLQPYSDSLHCFSFGYSPRPVCVMHRGHVHILTQKRRLFWFLSWGILEKLSSNLDNYNILGGLGLSKNGQV